MCRLWAREINSMLEHTVVAEEDGFRADKVVAGVFKEVSYHFLQKLFRTKKIKVNGKRAAASDHLKEGDIVKIFVSQTSLENPKAPVENKKVDTENSKKKGHNLKLSEQFQKLIIFEDEDLIAINKPTNLAVQMGSKVKVSVETMMRAYKNDLRLVHRIDKDTSGILLIAKGRLAAQKLTKMFRENKIKKTYLAIVDGKIQKSGTIDNYLHKRVIGNEEKIAVYECKGGSSNLSDELSISESIQHAITEYVPHKINDANFRYYTLMELHPKTGRKHQLRVHCADVLHAPILGDKKYDRNYAENYSKNPEIYRYLMLHAYKVQIEKGNGSRDKKNKTEIIANPPQYFPIDYKS